MGRCLTSNSNDKSREAAAEGPLGIGSTVETNSRHRSRSSRGREGRHDHEQRPAVGPPRVCRLFVSPPAGPDGKDGPRQCSNGDLSPAIPPARGDEETEVAAALVADRHQEGW